MKENEKLLLDSIADMAESAPGVGLCSAPFLAVLGQVKEIIAEKDALMEYRTPKPVIENFPWSGRCPSCGAIFLDDSTNYCGNCGQRIMFGK